MAFFGKKEKGIRTNLSFWDEQYIRELCWRDDWSWRLPLLVNMLYLVQS